MNTFNLLVKQFIIWCFLLAYWSGSEQMRRHTSVFFKVVQRYLQAGELKSEATQKEPPMNF